MLVTVVVLAIVIGVGGCQTAKVAEPLPASVMGNDAGAQMEFWHAMPSRPIATNDEAFHAILLFVDDADKNANYNERVAMLKQRDMLPAGFDGQANEAVQRGTLAVMIVKILDIKGGLTMHVFGPVPRYAMRELQFMNLYPPGSPRQTFSGSELLGIIGRVEDYQRGQALARLAKEEEMRPHEQKLVEEMRKQ